MKLRRNTNGGTSRGRSPSQELWFSRNNLKGDPEDGSKKKKKKINLLAGQLRLRLDDDAVPAARIYHGQKRGRRKTREETGSGQDCLGDRLTIVDPKDMHGQAAAADSKIADRTWKMDFVWNVHLPTTDVGPTRHCAHQGLVSGCGVLIITMP